MRRTNLAKATPNRQLFGVRRQTLLTAAVAACAAIVACEDGPNQTFAPPGANAAWNDGRPQGSTAPAGTATSATAPFANPDGTAIGSGGTNANEICTQAQIAAITPKIATAPILLPNGGGGLNLAGTDKNGNVTWQGLTIEQAEQVNCQGTPSTDLFGDLQDLNVLWDNGGVVAEYAISNHKVDYIGLGIYSPYSGVMTVCSNPTNGTCSTSTPSNTTYVIAVDGQTQIAVTTTDSSGSPSTSTLSLDWLNASNGVASAIVPFDALYRASMATFFPSYPVESPNFTCNQTGACIIGTFPAGEAYFFIPALGWAMWVYPYYVPTEANAIDRMDINFAQIMNFSGANPVLKLDSTGPTTIPAQVGSGAAACQLSLGLDYTDFLNNCVLTAPGGTTAPANVSENLELFSALSHDEEIFNFDIAGVDLTFADTRLALTQTVVDPPLNGGCGVNPTDPACPQGPDVANEMNVDQSTLSNIANDWIYDSNGNAMLHDLHGAGALYNDYRTIAITSLQSEFCANVNVPVTPPPSGDGGSGDAGTSADAGSTGPQLTTAQAICAAWQSGTLTTQIQGCIAARDPSTGALDPAFNPGAPLPMGCTGMENLVSTDITTPDDPVNIGPIATMINPTYTLGMKMGHQQGSFCLDAMSRNQIAAQSFTLLCPSGADSCPAPGQSGFACASGSCDPTQGTCAAGTPTCTTTEGTATALTVAQVDLIGEVGTTVFLSNPTNANPAVPAPAGTSVIMSLPQFCYADNLLPLSHTLVINNLGGGTAASLPVDIQDNRFYFKAYGLALIQTLEASTLPNAGLSAPVAAWGPPTLGSLMPVQINDLFFDSSGDGQFESMEYVDRRFVCPDGAQNCAPAGSTSFTCPAASCAPPYTSCPANTTTCNANETAQAPLDIQFGADVKDGIMNNYDITRYQYRGEAAMYAMIDPPGFAPAAASNALFSNIFGSALLSSLTAPPNYLVASNNNAQLFPTVDLTGAPIDPNDYQGVWTPTPLSLSYSQQGSSPLVIGQTIGTDLFPGAQQALITYPDPNSSSGSSQKLLNWVPNQPGNGFSSALVGDSTLDTFIQAASIDFTGVSTTGLVDYNIVPAPTASDPAATGVEELAAESTDFLGDVFMCYEPAANPPLLAVRMYTPTLAVLNWLNSVPQSYTDCGIVVRWSPYDTFVNLIESTTYGVRLQVTQGGGLGRIVGATVYVPNLPHEQ